MILLLEFNTSRQIMNNELINLVINSRNKVYQIVNTEMLSLY